jgi:steroid delta-isomerase-like uncharacterized protein
MTGEEQRNMDTVRRNWELTERAEYEAALELWADDCRNHGRPVGKDGMRKVWADIRTTFPDWHLTIVDMIARGTEVVVIVRASGTHLGVGTMPVNGGMLLGVPPTGRRIDVQHIHWFTFNEKGKIANHRASRDDLGMMQQLGLLPSTHAGS